ncbi:hypothetical protein [Aeromonas hydrophila]|jgi:hypothetical protein|uniref:hypothetical protein n=2 Tax=Aeromonas TaxID=642 RepID=UPI003F676DBB
MMDISKMVEKATVLRDRIFATAAVMTVNQTYMAAVTDLKIPPNLADLEESLEKLKELAVLPVHGKRQWMLDHAWDTLITLIGDKIVGGEDEESLDHLFNNGSFTFVQERFEADFSVNLRFAEQCSQLLEE